jgi:hypothetical protein
MIIRLTTRVPPVCEKCEREFKQLKEEEIIEEELDGRENP